MASSHIRPQRGDVSRHIWMHFSMLMLAGSAFLACGYPCRRRWLLALLWVRGSARMQGRRGACLWRCGCCLPLHAARRRPAPLLSRPQCRLPSKLVRCQQGRRRQQLAC